MTPPQHNLPAGIYLILSMQIMTSESKSLNNKHPHTDMVNTHWIILHKPLSALTVTLT